MSAAAAHAEPPSAALEDTEPDEPATQDALEQSTSVLRCAQCNHPIAAAADLLPEQIPRLESASYPYQLDLLGNEEAWVYSATNPHQNRFDVCRFGAAACARLDISGTPTAEHSFFPPFAWRMAACACCSAHLGWAFGVAEGGGPDFAGLILTHLRETQCTQRELNAPPVAVPAELAEYAERLREAEGNVVPGSSTAFAGLLQLRTMLRSHTPAGRERILAQLRRSYQAEAAADAGNAASDEMSARGAAEVEDDERWRVAEVIQMAAFGALAAEAWESERAGSGSGEEPARDAPDGGGTGGGGGVSDSAPGPA